MNLHTALIVQRVLARYCARICPPSARHAVALEFSIDGPCVTIVEVRTFCGVPGMRRAVELARFRHHPPRGDWSLWYLDAAGEWRRYPRRAKARSFVEVLRTLDADPEGLYWGRVNGKSLRWCSARGRCPGCEERYGEILGLGGTGVSVGGGLGGVRRVE